MLDKNPARHRYFTADGEEVPGVTTVLGILNKPALVAWAFNCGCQYETERSKDEARLSFQAWRERYGDHQIGHIAHYLVHCSLSGKTPEISPDYSSEQIETAKVCSERFFKYYRKRGSPTLLFSEHSMVHERERFGGTPDLVVKTDSGVELWDIKTSAWIYPEYYFQLAAYAELLMQNPDYSGYLAFLAKLKMVVVNVTKEGGLNIGDMALGSPKAITANGVWDYCLSLYRAIERYTKASTASFSSKLKLDTTLKQPTLDIWN